MDQLSSDLASLRIGRDTTPSGPSPVKRVVVALVVIVVVGVGGYLGLGAVGARVFKQQVTLTEVSLISPSQASVQVTSTGYVVPQITSKVGAKISGRLEKVLIKEGDTVKAGDILAMLADADQKSAVAAASSRVLVARARSETARANLAEVTRQLERTRGLLAGNAVPRAQFEDLETRAQALAEAEKAAKAEAVASEAETQTLRVGLRDRVIVAPISGTVITKPAAIGETVSLSSVIAELADFSSLLVETDVPESRLGLVKVGSPCEIVLDAYPTRRYRGVTTEIGKRVNRAKATVVAKVKFEDNADGVLPDMAARVSFLREAIKAEALQEKPKKVVAVDAVVERDGRKVVFVVEDGKARMVPVLIAGVVGGSLELQDGPSVGARVVRNPTKELQTGTKIKASTEE